ncbi:hypothetical protein TWF718_008139 [Orbilia javanica]|uniref:Uncharacterized protein n=1 Tax=Orbilia javanica TaxID=47235 RepID=A0AAN8MQW6_9PEZI
MTSSLINILFTPGFYIDPATVNPGTLDGYEQCGTDKWCFLAPANITGVCGTWFGQDEHCCWAAAIENGMEGIKTCGDVDGIRNTPFDQFGSSDAFNATGSTCPSGSFEIFDTDTESSTIASCCPNGQTSQAYYILPNSTFTGFYLEGAKCGTFEVPGELLNPTPQSSSTGSTSVPESTSSVSTGGIGPPASTTSGSEPTSESTAPADPTETGTTTTTGGGSAPTGSGSTTKPSKMSYLIAGSLIFGLFLGGSL